MYDIEGVDCDDVGKSWSFLASFIFINIGLFIYLLSMKTLRLGSKTFSIALPCHTQTMDRLQST